MDTLTVHPVGGRRFGPSSRSARSVAERGVARTFGTERRRPSGAPGRGAGAMVLGRPEAFVLAPVRPAAVSTGAAVSAGSWVRSGGLAASAAMPSVRPMFVPERAPEPVVRPDAPPRRDPRPRRRPGRSAARRPPTGVVDVRPAVPVGCPMPADTDPGYRMSRWARLGMTLTVTAAIVVAAVVLIGRGGSGRTGFVTVEPGDTLWSVASRTAPDRDPRDVVAELIRLNGLSSGAVHPGEVLRIVAG